MAQAREKREGSGKLAGAWRTAVRSLDLALLLESGGGFQVKRYNLTRSSTRSTQLQGWE